MVLDNEDVGENVDDMSAVENDISGHPSDIAVNHGWYALDASVAEDLSGSVTCCAVLICLPKLYHSMANPT